MLVVGGGGEEEEEGAAATAAAGELQHLNHASTLSSGGIYIQGQAFFVYSVYGKSGANALLAFGPRNVRTGCVSRFWTRIWYVIVLGSIISHTSFNFNYGMRKMANVPGP